MESNSFRYANSTKCWHLVGGLVAAILFSSAWAQTGTTKSSQKRVEELLTEIKPAVCRPDDAQPAHVGNVSRSNTVPDIGCAISPVEALPVSKHTNAAVVDTRSFQEFSRFHIDGALNLGTGELRVKGFLRGKHVVLVGDGKSERELYAACGELKRIGFKQVQVLHGGMPAWLAASQVVVGSIADWPRQIRLTPEQLWTEAQFDANLIFLSTAQETLRKEFPTANFIRDDSSVAIKDALTKQARKKAQGPIASVVFVASAGVSDEAIDQIAQAVKPHPLLVYADTSEAYRYYLRTQEMRWKAYARGPKQAKCAL